MRFKVDENLPEELAELLRDAGWDCSSVVEQQLGGEDDSRIAGICSREGRILVTLDRGLSNIRTYPPLLGAGTIVFRLRLQDKHNVLAVTTQLVQTLMRRELRNELWIVHETRIRIRPASKG